MTVNVKLVHPDAKVPEYQTSGAAGFDLAIVEDAVLKWQEPQLCSCGIVIETPRDHFLLLAPRSSTYKKWGVSLANTIGVVDSDYAGNDDVIALNLIWTDETLVWTDETQEGLTLDGYSLKIPAGTRLAQGLFIPVAQTGFQVVKDMTQQTRGGFGTTG